MSTKADYTEDEWQLLIDGPALVGTAVLLAGESGMGGSFKESMAIASQILNGRKNYPDTELVQSIVASRIKDRDRTTVENRHDDNPYLGLEPKELLARVVETCRQINTLLRMKSTTDETSSYKAWMMEIGQAVAEAAKEGSILGIGGERVSEAEIHALDEIRTALELT